MLAVSHGATRAGLRPFIPRRTDGLCLCRDPRRVWSIPSTSWTVCGTSSVGEDFRYRSITPLIRAVRRTRRKSLILKIRILHFGTSCPKNRVVGQVAIRRVSETTAGSWAVPAARLLARNHRVVSGASRAAPDIDAESRYPSQRPRRAPIPARKISRGTLSRREDGSRFEVREGLRCKITKWRRQWNPDRER
jgi:hypothetical protein